MAIRFLDEEPPQTRSRIRFLDEAPSPIQQTEARIAGRTSLRPQVLRDLTATPRAILSLAAPRPEGQSRVEQIRHALGEMGRSSLQAPLHRISALQEVGESLTASPIVSAQAGRDVGTDILDVLKGKRVVERGDILRQRGASEPVAALFGLATSPEQLIPGALAVQGVGREIQAGMRGMTQFLRLGRPSTIGKLNIPREQLVRRVQQRLLKSPKLAGREFEQGLEEVVKAHPTQTVNLSESLGSYLEKAQTNPAFKTLIQRQTLNNQESALVQYLLNQPGAASNLTLKESQMVKQIFQRVNKQKFTQIDPDFYGAHLDALEVWHQIRAAQLTPFPEFKVVLQGYRKVLQDFRVIKNALKEGAVEGNLLKNLGADSQKIKAFRELATPETVKMVERLQKATETRSFIRRLGLVGAGIVVAKAVGKPVLGLFGLRTSDQ